MGPMKPKGQAEKEKPGREARGPAKPRKRAWGQEAKQRRDGGVEGERERQRVETQGTNPREKGKDPT